MLCPAPPGYFTLPAPQIARLFWLIAALTGGWLLVLLGCALVLLRREIRRLPPPAWAIWEKNRSTCQ